MAAADAGEVGAVAEEGRRRHRSARDDIAGWTADDDVDVGQVELTGHGVAGFEHLAGVGMREIDDLRLTEVGQLRTVAEEARRGYRGLRYDVAGRAGQIQLAGHGVTGRHQQIGTALHRAAGVDAQRVLPRRTIGAVAVAAADAGEVGAVAEEGRGGYRGL